MAHVKGIMTARRTPRILPLARAMAAAGAIALVSVGVVGCAGGAQNDNPVGKQPGASAHHTSGAQSDKPQCVIVGDATLQALSKQSSKGPVAVAYAKRVSAGWYLAGPIGSNTSYSSDIGLWATKGDVTSTDFASSFTSLNPDAQKSTSFPTTAPNGFSATASAAKQALGCAKSQKL